MLATMYGLDYIIPQISVVILALAVVIFCIGHVGRQELKEQREREANDKRR